MTNKEQSERRAIGEQMRRVARDWGGPNVSDRTIMTTDLRRLRAIKRELDADGDWLASQQFD